MNNKFHAISMCTLIAAFAASSWAAAESSCPEGTKWQTTKGGELYYVLSPSESSPITITMDEGKKSFKLCYNGSANSQIIANIVTPDENMTVSVTGGSADLSAGTTSLSIKNWIDFEKLGVPDLYMSYTSSYQSNENMYRCANQVCNSIPKKSGLNALQIVLVVQDNSKKSFELTVQEERYDFGPMQVFNIEKLDGTKLGTVAGLASVLGFDLSALPVDKLLLAIENGLSKVAYLNGKNVDEKTALNNAFKGIPSNVDVDYVYLDREFTVSGSELYSTLTLPFSISKAKIKNVSNVYAFKNIEGNKAHFTSADMLDAYTPYLIELVDEATGIEFLEGVTLQSSKDKSGKDISTDVQDGQWVFHGTLNYKKWDKNNNADKAVLEGCNGKSCAYGYAASGTYQGQFVRIGDGAYIFPFRAYLFYNKPQSLAPANASYVLRPTVDIPDEMEIVVDGDNGQTTSIGRFDTRTGEIHINNMKHTYDLKGRRVNGTNNARGAYYGKKVLMK